MNTLRDQQAQRILSVYGVSAASDDSIVKSEDTDLEKGGEGSKGGNIIGHTKSGKAIYANSNHESHGGFSKEDHEDAADAHRDKMKEHNDKKEGHLYHKHMAERDVHVALSKKDSVEKSDSFSILESIANGTFEKSDSTDDKLMQDKENSEETAPESSEGGEKEEDNEEEEGESETKQEVKKSHNGAGLAYGSNGTADFIKSQRDRILSCYNTDIEKSEGARGGKVIGHTKSGKPIYDSHDHESHKDFTRKDHSDAIDAHIKHMNKMFDRRVSPKSSVQSGGGVLKQGVSREEYEHHDEQAIKHNESKNDLPRE